MAPSTNDDILISVHSRHRSSPHHPLLQHALVAQPSAADDAGAGAGAGEEASVDGDGVHGCDDGIRAAASSPQMAISTAPGPCTITVLCDDASHAGEGEGNNTTTVELVGAGRRHSGGASGAVAVAVPLSETAAAAGVDDEHDDEQGHHDEDYPDPVDSLADELEDDDDDGPRAARDDETREGGGGNQNFLTEVYEFLLQEMEPEENEQFHLQIATTGLLTAELLAAFTERITRGIAAGRLRNPLVPAAAATTTTPMMGSDAYRGGGFGGVPAAAAAIAGLEKRRYDAASGDGDGGGEGCVVCLVDYEHGDELAVMPCAHGHAFHRECIAEWLARSHLCPLCRHALPTEDQEEVS